MIKTKMNRHHILYLHLSFICFFYSLFVNCEEQFEIHMPNVTTNKDDAYLCTAYKLKANQNYLTAFQPLVNSTTSHHLTLMACAEPASQSLSWKCNSQTACRGESARLFGWSRDAPFFKLLPDVSFKVTQFKYIVMNIHYAHPVNRDNSGLAITTTDKPRKYEAGILTMATNPKLLQPKTKKLSTTLSCKYTGPSVNLHGILYHAHKHGTVIAAYRVRGGVDWTELGIGDPQWPQTYYPTKSVYEIKEGDILVGMCSYSNDEDRVVRAGNTDLDEMCNIYLIYYTSNRTGAMANCFGSLDKKLEASIPDSASVRPHLPLRAVENVIDPENAAIHNVLSEQDWVQWLTQYKDMIFMNWFLIVIVLLLSFLVLANNCLFNRLRSICSKCGENDYSRI